MKSQFHKVLKKNLRHLAMQTRHQLGLTQAEMSELLQINESSYSDIETGKFCCGTLTAVFLLCLQEKPEEFLRKFAAEVSWPHDPGNGKH